MNSLERLQHAATTYEDASTNGEVTDRRLAELNALLFSSERLLTRVEGLPGRPWYTHHIYAPGFYTGYGVKTIPGVRESIEQREFDDVEAQIAVAAGVVDRMAQRIAAAAGLYER